MRGRFAQPLPTNIPDDAMGDLAKAMLKIKAMVAPLNFTICGLPAVVRPYLLWSVPIVTTRAVLSILTGLFVMGNAITTHPLGWREHLQQRRGKSVCNS